MDSEPTPVEIHHRALESMYLAAPINRFYRPRIGIGDGVAWIEGEASEDFHHSGGAVHGSVYFKMLDDAAFFAAGSLETEFFVLTTSFTCYLTRPVSSGLLRAEGKAVSSNRTQILAEAVLYDGQGREIGRGNGLFVRSKMPLRDARGYGQGPADPR